MRKFLLATSAALMMAAPATAADMPVKSRPLPPPVPVFSWTGFYIGGHVGGAWGTTESTLNSVSVTFDRRDECTAVAVACLDSSAN